MRESLKKRADLFVGNTLSFKRGFAWDSYILFPVCASIFTDKDRVVDVDRIKECKKLIDSNTSILSNFRGNLKLPLASVLAVSENPQYTIDQAKIYYEMIREKFMSSPYAALIAGSLGRLTTVSDAPEYIAKGRKIYDGMKKRHPFLTSGQDSVLAVLLAFSNKSEDSILEEMEKLYKGVNDYVSAADTIQSVSHVLTITDDDYRVKLEKFKKIARTFMPEGKNYKLGVEAISFAALSLLPVETADIISDLKEVEAFLKTKRGYGFFGYSRHDRRAHAAMILAAHYATMIEDDSITDKARAAEVASSLAMLAAQQAAICCCIASASASAVTHS